MNSSFASVKVLRTSVLLALCVGVGEIPICRASGTNTIDEAALLAEEVVFSEAGNVHNPTPSPDGTKIACVRTGWGRGGPSPFGRGNLRSEVIVLDATGRPVTQKPLADAFLAGWTSEGKQLICYRDRRCFLVSIDGQVSQDAVTTNNTVGKLIYSGTERVTFLPKKNSMVWFEHTQGGSTTRGPDRDLVQNPELFLGDMIVPSPDERYLAAIGSRDAYSSNPDLWVYDWKNPSWADLGPVSIHPSSDWDYIKPAWNPWFKDSSRLAFVSEGKIIVATPDGKNKVVIATPQGRAGLAAPSPNGAFVSYVTFEPRAKKVRTDLTFWGNTTVFVARTAPPWRSVAITEKNPDTIYSLNWLNQGALVFDRLADEALSMQARVSKMTLKDGLFAKLSDSSDASANTKPSSSDGGKVEATGGFIIVGDKKFIIKSALAGWIEKNSILRVFLFPYEIGQGEIDYVKKGHTPLGLVERKPSPDTSQWADWCPSVQLEIIFRNPRTGFIPQAVLIYSLIGYYTMVPDRFDEYPGSTQRGLKEFKEMSVDTKVGGEVRIWLKRDDELAKKLKPLPGKPDMDYDFRVKTQVIGNWNY